MSEASCFLLSEMVRRDIKKSKMILVPTFKSRSIRGGEEGDVDLSSLESKLMTMSQQ